MNAWITEFINQFGYWRFKYDYLFTYWLSYCLSFSE